MNKIEQKIYDQASLYEGKFNVIKLIRDMSHIYGMSPGEAQRQIYKMIDQKIFKMNRDLTLEILQ